MSVQKLSSMRGVVEEYMKNRFSDSDEESSNDGTSESNEEIFKILNKKLEVLWKLWVEPKP